MSGGFLLCEYLPGIEDLFEIDKEIVCFKDLEDATTKIRYYLAHEAERQAIAEAGWIRAQRDHILASRLRNAFEKIEKTVTDRQRSATGVKMQFDMPPHVRKHPSFYHFMWAMGLMVERFPRKRWQEELDLSLFYDPKNVRARLLRLISLFPESIRVSLSNLWIALARFKNIMMSKRDFHSETRV